MQRVGMLPIAVAAASERRPVTFERAARDFARVVQREMSVPSEHLGQFSTYVNSLRLWKRYRHLQERAITSKDRVEIQDLWLADPALPAATGAITPEVVEDIPQLAANLRLIRPQNYTRTDRGRALLASLSEECRAVTEGSSGAIAPNPLAPPLGAQLLLLYALLEADGDFVRAVYKPAPLFEEEFTRPDFTDRLDGVCQELARLYRPRMRTGQDRKLLLRLQEWASEIERPRQTGSKWGGGRPPEQLGTLRLEPYVDLGLVTRRSRYAYRYALSEQQRGFFNGLAAVEEVEEFLHGALVGAWCEARGEHRTRLSSEQAWPFIVSAYKEIRSPLGQASFVEVALLAIGTLLESHPDQYFEIADGIEAITNQRRRNPKGVRLGVNRRGALTYMKIQGAGNE